MEKFDIIMLILAIAGVIQGLRIWMQFTEESKQELKKIMEEELRK
jgi:hypothetical protein